MQALGNVNASCTTHTVNDEAVLLAILLAEEEKLICSITECNEDGTGEVYLSLPQGIVKFFFTR